MPIRRLVLILSGCLLLCTCTEDSPTETGPDPDPTPVPAFPISYTTDDARAVSSRISASQGGSIAATDAEGAEFRLTIPPEALDSSTTITITPLSCLTIGGPGATRCSDSDTSGGRCCLTGALFGPAGLRLAKPATLEVTYGGTFPFPTTGTLIYFSEADSSFVPCSTEVDSASGVLRGTVRHFSGYGAAALDSTQLRALYEYYREQTRLDVGRMQAFYTSLRGLLDIAEMNWQLDIFGEAQPIVPGLNNLIEQTAIERLAAHSTTLWNQSQQTTTKPVAEDLMVCHQLLEEVKYRMTGNLQWACTQDQAIVMNAIDPIVRHFAELGQSACLQDDCDGRDDLQWAYNVWIRGYFNDNAYGAQIRNWLEDCCGELDVEISVSPATLRRAGIRPDDTYGTYATVTVTVTGQSGQPKEDVHVAVRWSKNSSILCSGETDAAGQFVGYFSAHLPGTAFTCHEFLEYQVWAEASWVGGTYSSLDFPVIFQNVMVSASYSYTYALYEDNGQISTVLDCSVSGTLESPTGGCGGDCGTVTRAYHYNRGTYTIDVIGLQTRELCDGNASMAPQQITVGDGIPLTTYYINGVGVSAPCAIFERVLIESCEPPLGCTSDTADIPWCPDLSFCIRYPDICDGIQLQSDGTGGYVPFLWTFTDDYRSVTWSIDVSAGYSK